MRSEILKPAVLCVPVSILAPLIGAVYGAIRALHQGEYMLSGMGDETRIKTVLSERAGSNHDIHTTPLGSDKPH